MALLTKSVLGEIRGKMGNTVARKMNGKLFISYRPHKYKKQRKIIPARLKMRTVVPFCSTLNKVGELKNVWENSNINAGNAYQKMIKHALENTHDKKLSTKNKITPGGIDIIADRFELINYTLFIDISDQSEELNSLVGNNFSVYLLVYLYEPVDGKTETTNFFLTRKEFQEISVNGPINLELDLRENYKNMLIKFKKCTIYFAIISFESESNKFIFSDTLSKIVNLTG